MTYYDTELQERVAKLRNEGKDKLPKDWGNKSLEQKCAYLDELLKEILDYDCDFDINVTLQSKGNWCLACVQFTDEGCTMDYEPDYVRCHLVHRDSNVAFDDLPEEYQKYSIHNYGEEVARKMEPVDLAEGGKTFDEALESLFNFGIVLLFYGYECLYCRDDFSDYCEGNDDDEEDDEDEDDFDFNFDDDDDDEDEDDDDEQKKSVNDDDDDNFLS